MRRKRKRGMHSWLCFLRVDLSDVRDAGIRSRIVTRTGHAGYNGQRGEGGDIRDIAGQPAGTLGKIVEVQNVVLIEEESRQSSHGHQNVYCISDHVINSYPQAQLNANSYSTFTKGTVKPIFTE